MSSTYFAPYMRGITSRIPINMRYAILNNISLRELRNARRGDREKYKDIARQDLYRRLQAATNEKRASELINARIGHQKDFAYKQNIINLLVEQASSGMSLAMYCTYDNERGQEAIDNASFETIEGLIRAYNEGNRYAISVIGARDSGWLEEIDYVEMEGGQIIRNDETFICDHCSNRYECDESTNVYTDEYSESETWCEECCDEYSATCGVTGQRYSAQHMHTEELSNGTEFCCELCEERGLVEYDDDDECWYETGSDRMPGYHNAPRPWEGRIAPKNAIGVELEVGFPDGISARTSFLGRFVIRGRVKGLPFSVERDGSLDGIPGGMEVISDPLSLYEGYVAEDASWRKMLKILYTGGAAGWEYRAYAGIHVNMDRRRWPDDEIVGYALFINQAAALSKIIAGRKVIFRGGPADPKHMYTGGYSNFQNTWHDLRKINNEEYTKSELRNQVLSGVKYRPVCVARDRVETRIFGSNIRYAGFMACVEYCVAVQHFVRGKMSTDMLAPTISSEFRFWLVSQTKRYPNLTKRLGITAENTNKRVPLRAVA